jgi:hypothetical protein
MNKEVIIYYPNIPCNGIFLPGLGPVEEKYYINETGKKNGKYEKYWCHPNNTDNEQISIRCNYIDDKFDGK